MRLPLIRNRCPKPEIISSFYPLLKPHYLSFAQAEPDLVSKVCKTSFCYEGLYPTHSLTCFYIFLGSYIQGDKSLITLL